LQGNKVVERSLEWIKKENVNWSG